MFRSFLPVLMLCAGCASAPYRIVDSETGEDLALDALADRLAQADVVFLGEEHDSDTVHELQLALTRALGERREIALSLEMFERDVQPELDLYLSGATSEERFLAHARPWGNYHEHYRPAIELARERGWDVIAANAPRPSAARVAKEGLAGLRGDPYVATNIIAQPGPYRDRFAEAMGGHGHVPDLQRFFEAQVVKDETMAESIARYLARQGDDPPLVVHWCGKFHSDHGLGTVERLRRRRPELSLAVVSTLRGRKLGSEEQAPGEVLWLVRR